MVWTPALHVTPLVANTQSQIALLAARVRAAALPNLREPLPFDVLVDPNQDVGVLIGAADIFAVLGSQLFLSPGVEGLG